MFISIFLQVHINNASTIFFLHYISHPIQHIRMAALHFFSMFVMVLCANSFWCGKVDVKFDTKYDNNHNELKQLLAEHKTFTPTNWTHYAYVIMMIVGAVIIIIVFGYVYRCCWPMVKLIYHAQQHKNRIKKSLPIPPSYYQPPYTHTQTQFGNQILQHNNPSVVSQRSDPTSSIQLPPSRIV